MPKILIVDDEIEICKQVSLILEDEGFECFFVTNSQDCLLEINNHIFDLVLVDLWLKGSPIQGNELIALISNLKNNLVIISFSGHANIDNAIESLKSGANDFIEKPFETKKIIHIINKNLELLKNKLIIDNYRNKISFHTKIDFIGSSSEIDHFINKIDKIKIPENISIIGPRGTGKFYLANYIHNKISNNNFDSFINLNEILMSFEDISKLNTIHDYFTLYINDINEYKGLELNNLSAFLIKNNINASIVVDSLEDIDANYQLIFKSAFKIKPLKFRTKEIPLIFDHYIGLFANKFLNRTLLINPECYEMLIKYDWPGNIFEIMNISENIIRSIDLNKQSLFKKDLENHINNANSSNNLYNLNYRDAKNSFEKEYLVNKLKLNDWNVTNTARELKLDRVSLYRKIKLLKINLTE